MRSFWPLILVLSLGFFLRIGFLLFSHHLYYPDELFQFLEPAYRLVNGAGIIPWEFREGLRSWIIPGILAGILWTTKQFGLTYPQEYDFAIRMVLAILSLSSIWSVYTLTEWFTRKRRVAVAAAFAVAIWYEWVYVSGRPLSEVIASYLLLGGMALTIQVIASLACRQAGNEVIRTTRQSNQGQGNLEDDVTSNRVPRLGWKPGLAMTSLSAGLLLGIGTYLRIQYFLFPLLFIIFIYLKNKNKVHVKNILYGLVSGFGFGGWVDYLTWGNWFYSQTQNISLSFDAGISTIFGQEPWYWYVKQLLIVSSGGYLFALALPQKHRALGWLIGGLLILHSLFSHKEYRFVMVLIPLLLVAATIGYFHLTQAWLTRSNQQWLWYGGITLLSILGFLSKLPAQSSVYLHPILFKDNQLQLYQNLAQMPDLCGLFDSTSQWMETGGLYSLGKSVPLYSSDHPPTQQSYVNYVLVDSTNQVIPGFQKVEQRGTIILYKRVGGCDSDPSYTWNRYIPAVEEMLKK